MRGTDCRSCLGKASGRETSAPTPRWKTPAAPSWRRGNAACECIETSLSPLKMTNCDYHAGRIERPPNAALRYDSNDLFVAVQDFLPLSLPATRMARERTVASKQVGRFIPSCRLALNASRPKR